MYQGSCLCGAVRIEIHGGISAIIHCHCSLCRKSSGTAYATNGFVALSDFVICSGQETLTFLRQRRAKRSIFAAFARRRCIAVIHKYRTKSGCGWGFWTPRSANGHCRITLSLPAPAGMIWMRSYHAMTAMSQSGLCAACEIQLVDLRIDHCHKTGTVRGLLCPTCNVGVGFAEHPNLEKWHKYLQQK